MSAPPSSLLLRMQLARATGIPRAVLERLDIDPHATAAEVRAIVKEHAGADVLARAMDAGISETTRAGMLIRAIADRQRAGARDVEPIDDAPPSDRPDAAPDEGELCARAGCEHGRDVHPVGGACLHPGCTCKAFLPAESATSAHDLATSARDPAVLLAAQTSTLPVEVFARTHATACAAAQRTATSARAAPRTARVDPIVALAASTSSLPLDVLEAAARRIGGAR
jgi:hypothetical protein